MAEKDAQDNPGRRYYDKFNADLHYLVIFANAASINAKVDCMYPESFMAAFLSTGEHEITLALAEQGVDLEKLLNIFKELLAARRDPKLVGNVTHEDLKISKQVWDCVKEADQIAAKSGSKNIGIDHLFLSLLEIDEISKVLKDNGADITKLIEWITDGRFKKASKSVKKAKQPSSEIIESLCVNITEMARQNKLDPILARDDEIEEAITILCRRHKRNPMLVGEPGVGKSAIVDGIAQRIISGTVPPKLKNSKIFSLNVSDLVAGTKYRGEFETRIQGILKEIENDPSIILFIDEVHMIIGAGAGSGSVDAANMFKPALARGMRCIGATTHKEYKKYIAGDGALERRFEKVTVDEPTHEQVRQILTGIKHRLEEYHNCVIPMEAIEETIKLSERYLPSNYFPDKAIDCLDTACAKYAWSTDEKSAITPKDIQYVISKKTKIPLDVLSMDNLTRLKAAENHMRWNVIGQDKALDAIFRTLKNSYSGVRATDKPVGIFVLGGETGTGKTFTPTELAKALFKKDASFIRIDMSEYSEKHTVSRIIGSPPGYVGYEDADTELDKIKRNPYSLVLLDEIEKADPQVMKLFLQYMKDGFITDSSGERINCRNTLLVMTGNFGLNENKTSTLGFSEKKVSSQYETEQSKLVAACKALFGVEFVNRVDEFIPYLPLDKTALLRIIEMHLDNLRSRVEKNGITIEFAPEISNFLIKLKEKEHGANAMMIDRLISKMVEPLLADALLETYGVDNSTFSVKIYVDEFEKLAFSTTKKLVKKKK